MDTFNNHREGDRTDHRMRILYADTDTGECHPVRLLNYSENGIYFESLHSLKPGTVISFFSRGGIDPSHEIDESCSGYRSMSRAKVKWCRDLKDRDYPYFGIGAEYLPEH